MVKGNKGGRRGWTTPEQEKWLRHYEPLFLSSQDRGANGLADFWPQIFEIWFARWASADIKATKKRIKEWYNNHCRSGSRRGYVKVLDLKPKKVRKKLSTVQAYSVLYYDKNPHLKSTVAERWAAHIIAHPKDADKFPDLPFRNAVLKDLYALESDAVQARVGRFIEHPEQFNDDGSDADGGSDVENEGEAEEADLDPEEVERRDKAAFYDENQASITKSITFMLEQLEHETGFAGTIILGGPEPKRGGKLTMMSFHSGTTELGYNFNEVYHDRWVEHIEKPFKAFLKKVFPPDVCAARALPGTIATFTDVPVDNGPTSDATSKGKGRPTAREIERMARNMTGRILMEELKSERKSLSSEALASGSSASAQPMSSSPSTPSAAVIADPSDSTTGDAGQTTDTEFDAGQATDTESDTGPSADDPKSPIEGPPANTPATVTIVDPKSANAPVTRIIDGSGITTPILSRSPSENTPLQTDQVTGSATPEAGGVVEGATGRPAWLCVAVDYFKSISTSPEWIALVEKWVAFEAHLSFPSTAARLDCANRPDVVRVWLRGGRKFNAPPGIGKLSAYTVAWWAWWDSLQPEWRQGSLSAKVPPHGEKWIRTYIGGPNGMFIVILTLSWWIAKLSGEVTDNGLVSALNDVKWVIERMVISNKAVTADRDKASSTKKRPAADGNSDEPQEPLKKRTKTTSSASGRKKNKA